MLFLDSIFETIHKRFATLNGLFYRSIIQHRQGLHFMETCLYVHIPGLVNWCFGQKCTYWKEYGGKGFWFNCDTYKYGACGSQ